MKVPSCGRTHSALSMRNVFIEGIYREELPMWELHPVLCTNVIIRGVTIDSHGPITMAAIRILPRCAD